MAQHIKIGTFRKASNENSNPDSGGIFMTASEILMVIFTAVIAATGVIGAIIFRGQLNVMQGQLNEMKSAGAYTKTAADAAKESADASKIQADVAKDTFAKIQRPYIFIFGVERLITSDVDVIPIPYLEYTVANYGQTPAIIDTINAGFFSGQIPEIPIQVNFDHPLVISPVLPPQDQRKNLRELLPEDFIGENLGIVVDFTTHTTHPVPRLTPNESLFFRVIITYRGPFAKDYETSATWIYSEPESRFVQLNDAQYIYTV